MIRRGQTCANLRTVNHAPVKYVPAGKPPGRTILCDHVSRRTTEDHTNGPLRKTVEQHRLVWSAFEEGPLLFEGIAEQSGINANLRACVDRPALRENTACARTDLALTSLRAGPSHPWRIGLLQPT